MSDTTQKHTPGPWFVIDLINKGGGYGIGPEFEGIGPHAMVCFNGAEAEENAHLIAAAPELLAACRAIVAWEEAEKGARPYDEDGGAGYRGRVALCEDAFVAAHSAIAKAQGGVE